MECEPLRTNTINMINIKQKYVIFPGLRLRGPVGAREEAQ